MKSFNGKKVLKSFIVPTFLAVTVLFSCAQTPAVTQKETLSYYQKANELFAKGKYGDAVQYYQKAEKGLPFLSPQQIALMKYRLGVAYFKEKKYADAILALEDFIDNYPGSAYIQQAYLYLIKAYLKIAPDAWRDPSYTEKAIKLAEEFLQKFPDSPYRAQVYQLLIQARKKLAKHYYLIAKFYEDYGYYYPAAVRFEYLLVTYPQYIDKRDVLFHYIKNLYLTPLYAKKKIAYWNKKARELKEKIKRGEVVDKKAAEKRVEYYKQQAQRWENISKEAVKAADENLALYKRDYGEDNNYKLLLKIKKGEWTQSWIEKIL